MNRQLMGMKSIEDALTKGETTTELSSVKIYMAGIATGLVTGFRDVLRPGKADEYLARVDAIIRNLGGRK